MKKKYLVLGLSVIVIIAAVILFQGKEAVEETSDTTTQLNADGGIQEGNIAKDFLLTTIEGNVVRLSDYRGKYVLFASMATWCTPCQIEAQNVRSAQTNFENSPLVVMQIDVDHRETNQDLERFRQQLGRKDWIMGFDDGSISSLYNIRTFDTTVVINPQGEIVYRDNGFPMDTRTLEDLIVRGAS